MEVPGHPHRDGRDRTATSCFARAMEDARWELTAKLGKDIDTWSWGRLHQLTLKNQTLGTDGPGFAAVRCSTAAPGTSAAARPRSTRPAGTRPAATRSIWVPSMRMVVNLGDFDKSRWINLTGASGHAYSAHYTDQTGQVGRGRAAATGPSRTRRSRSTSDTLPLTP